MKLLQPVEVVARCRDGQAQVAASVNVCIYMTHTHYEVDSRKIKKISFMYIVRSNNLFKQWLYQSVSQSVIYIHPHIKIPSSAGLVRQRVFECKLLACCCDST